MTHAFQCTINAFGYNFIIFIILFINFILARRGDFGPLASGQSNVFRAAFKGEGGVRGHLSP